MNKHLYSKLARQNIKANKETFLPFLLCSMAMVAMYFMLTVLGDITYLCSV